MSAVIVFGASAATAIGAAARLITAQEHAMPLDITGQVLGVDGGWADLKTRAS